jgi:hypothetical protein
MIVDLMHIDRNASVDRTAQIRLPQPGARLGIDPPHDIRHRWQDHHIMGAAVLQLHTRKNERLTLGTARVAEDRNRCDATNALGCYIVPRKGRLAGVGSRAAIVESTSRNRPQSLPQHRQRDRKHPDKTN